MNSASNILTTARDKFNSAATHSIGCISNCSGRCSCQNANGHNNTCSGNSKYTYTNIISNSNAMYCAGFDPKIHYSTTTSYKCPGHRDSKSNDNRYSLPININNNNIIYASQLNQLYANIKNEILTRLNHIFYNDLTF